MGNRFNLAGADISVSFRQIPEKLELYEDAGNSVCIFQQAANTECCTLPKAALMTKRGIILELFSRTSDGKTSRQYVKTDLDTHQLRNLFNELGLQTICPTPRKPTIVDRIRYLAHAAHSL